MIPDSELIERLTSRTMKDRNKVGPQNHSNPRIWEMTSHDAHYNSVAIERMEPDALVRHAWRREHIKWSTPASGPAMEARDLNKIATTGFIDPDRIPWDSPWVLHAMSLTHYLRWLKETKGEIRCPDVPAKWSNAEQFDREEYR